jgi:hypothetical protein
VRYQNIIGIMSILTSVTACSSERTVVTGYGFVELDVSPGNRIIGLQTTLTVPANPPRYGTLFLWPGLQPQTGGEDYEPIGNGVLQPVLAWGTSCAPGMQPPMYSAWWISGQYYDTEGSDPAHHGCYGGPVMEASVGEKLDITMTLSGTVWEQTVRREGGAEVSTVRFAEDLTGQAQNRAEFVIEGYACEPISDVVFTDTTITFALPNLGDCNVARRGEDDFISTPEASPDGSSCFIEKIVLRAKDSAGDD